MTTLEANRTGADTRLKLAVRGAVQGVGFRPFVHRLANAMGLTGWVRNSPQGVCIEVEGTRSELEQFRHRLEVEKPPHSLIQTCEVTWLASVGHENFTIRESDPSGSKTALVLPDLSTCPDCRREIFDPTDRRFRYPFTNCTNCGPRFSIIEALPYDRVSTSMKQFTMCPLCQAEYDAPANRRFHAQPNACSVCGPQVELWPGDARPTAGEAPRLLARGNDALLAAAHVIRCGQILAVKGIGGFHLLVDARNDEAVRRLRERKQREEKPFAVMFPSLASVREVCAVTPLEERLLCSTGAPIVLLPRRHAALRPASASLSCSVAPANPNLGVMLASNPLHHLLMADLGFPVVATSGNLSDEPICTEEFEALGRLRGIADVFLVHNRPIARHVDDSIARVTLDREMVLRRARGYAPLPIGLRSQPSTHNSQTILAVGAHLKNAVALAVGEQVFTSQHLGDLETEPAHNAFLRAVADLPRLYDAPPEIIVADLHPDYLSTKYAETQTTGGAQNPSRPVKLGVQHHVAHVLSCIAENEVELPALGVAWDGTGYGPDGTIWGSEFFLVAQEGVKRVAHLRPFQLPGGEAAVKEPRRAALGLIHQVCGEGAIHCRGLASVAAFTHAEIEVVKTMLIRGLNTPWCSSVGRLFDAVASLTGLRQETKYEGQAAMELEFALNGSETQESYELPLMTRGSALVLDWSPLIEAIVCDVKRNLPVGEISAKFHHALADGLVKVAQKVNCPRVALSGGCFQNRYLTERAVKRLREEGFEPFWQQRVPTNDGGIALGQVFAARHGLTLKS